MEIVNLQGDIYQVISTSDGSVLYQGSHDDCLCYEEHELYKMFMSMENF
jgi:hypothetical protein